jgi:hypothetical protein
MELRALKLVCVLACTCAGKRRNIGWMFNQSQRSNFRTHSILQAHFRGILHKAHRMIALAACAVKQTHAHALALPQTHTLEHTHSPRYTTYRCSIYTHTSIHAHTARAVQRAAVSCTHTHTRAHAHTAALYNVLPFHKHTLTLTNAHT